MKPDGVTNESIQEQLTDALERAIQLIYTMSVSCKGMETPWGTIRRWENLVNYVRKELS